jgi:hypothetical protein
MLWDLCEGTAGHDAQLLDPLKFECSHRRRTPLPSPERIRRKALLPGVLQVVSGPLGFECTNHWSRRRGFKWPKVSSQVGLVTGYEKCPCSQAHQDPGPSGKMPEFLPDHRLFGNGTAGNWVGRLLAGVPREQKVLRGRLPRVIYHRVY